MGTDHVPLRLSEHSRVLLHHRYGCSTMVYPYRPASQFTKTHPECYGTRTDCGQPTLSRLGFRSSLSCWSLLQSWGHQGHDSTDDQYVPNGKYIRPPAATINRSTEPAKDIPSPSISQAPSTNQLLHQILERLDRLDRKEK